MTMILSMAASFWTSAVLLLCLHSGDCTEIIGGKEVTPHSLPYMALLENNDGRSRSNCGGILIHQQWVLTAAHCSHMKKVLLGVHAINKEEKETRQVRKVKSEVPHPCFDHNSTVNDIMLLKLDKKVKLSKAVNIPPLPDSVDDVPAGTVCSVSGWGLTKDSTKAMSNVLKSANLTVIDRRKCNSPEYYNMKPIITYKMLCAGFLDDIKVDACKGDSGGPLMCGGKLRGVVSFGEGCGVKTKPGVYTLVTKYLDWIKKTMGKKH
ncbi:granzyme A-like precursor [Esox lucius]|uniref:trypsin n=1 Tax=Esox lucius TaxID=8010 RepID=C1BXH7_ESOLU|nr:granzyme A-like precursor [Esox lucius]ACO13730.1 Granzyme A precursor [Esox lucius]